MYACLCACVMYACVGGFGGRSGSFSNVTRGSNVAFIDKIFCHLTGLCSVA